MQLIKAPCFISDNLLPTCGVDGRAGRGGSRAEVEGWRGGWGGVRIYASPLSRVRGEQSRSREVRARLSESFSSRPSRAEGVIRVVIGVDSE